MRNSVTSLTIPMAFLCFFPAAQAQCVVDIASLEFSEYDGRTAINVNADIVLRCDVGDVYVIELSQGSGSSYAPRAMVSDKDTSSKLSYNLFTDAAHQVVWGDGTAATVTVSGAGNGSDMTHVVFGQLPASQQNDVSGTYHDRIEVTVTF